MKNGILERLAEIAGGLGIDRSSIALSYPEDPAHGEFSSNLALVNAKKAGLPPRELAEKIAALFREGMPGWVQSVEIAGPGFINFKVKDRALLEEVLRMSLEGESIGRSGEDAGKKVMVEYTDPNPFKVLHIGHLMSNAIGESISRLLEFSGAKVLRANWQGDVGPHVAKAVWGAGRIKPEGKGGPAYFWGQAYAAGAEAYDNDPAAKAEIEVINRKIYARSDPEVNALYDRGRAESLEAFEEIYRRLGTKFDHYFFEGTEGRNGEALVKEYLDKGVFEKSEGAIIFKGEKFGLHTRVFITSQGLPTYETKELGLNKEKFKIHPDLSESIIVTANEQNDYFKVLLKVMELIYPEIARKSKHISHGMLRFASGKMSSRKGNVVAAEALIDEIKGLVEKKIAERKFDGALKEKVSDLVAIGAIKYTILRQSVGSDVIFDSAASISFEGDSGPYLQYAAVRALSVLEKASAEGIAPASGVKSALPEKAGELERLLTRFPDVVRRARKEYAPQIVAAHISALAAAWNSFYASQIIVDKGDELSPYRVALAKTFLAAMKNGLWLLGIAVPEKM